MGQSANITPNEVTFRMGLEGESFSKAINIFLLMTALSLVPAFIMMMTSFTRILIVVGFLKKAMGTTAPSAKIISAMALFLTVFIMQPTWSRIYEESIKPYTNDEISQEVALQKAVDPIKTFMLRQMVNREDSLTLFMDLNKMDPVESPDMLPMTVVIPAFMISELKTAFQMGFLIYLPFLLVDIVVATTLMSMGMMMLPPMMISMPFKLLLFIVIDGWTLMIKSLVVSFN
jgi:flagellar biosynthesis protein FliP